MTSIQRIIKYIAIAFAIFLSVSIIGGIVSALFGIFGGIFAFNMFSKTTSIERVSNEVEYNAKEVSDLKIDVKVGEIEVKESDTDEIIKVKTENVSNDFKIELNEEKLSLKDDTDNVIAYGDIQPKVTIYIPRNQRFNEVNISNGAGTLDIKTILADKITIGVGAGKIDADRLESDKLKIDGGAGKIDIKYVVVNTLDISAGVGKIDLIGSIKENANINGGIGKIKIGLVDDINNYKVKASTGIGGIIFNGQNCNDDQTIGNGNVSMKVDGGVGPIEITPIKIEY